MPDDRNAAPSNGTFASRAAAPGEVVPRRRTSLRAGADAETDFEITYTGEGVDRVQPITV
jgi:hypothetical protein